MDNKALADIVKLEVSKLENCVNKLRSEVRNLIKREESASHDTGRSDAHQAAGIGDPHPRSQNPLSNPPPAGTDQNSTDQKKHVPEWLKFFLESVGIVVLIVYTSYTGCQTSRIGEANRLTRESTEETLKARLHVARVEATFKDQSTFDVFIENTGHVPTSSFAGEFEVTLAPKTVPPGIARRNDTRFVYHYGGLDTQIAPGKDYFEVVFSDRDRRISMPETIIIHSGIIIVAMAGHLYYGNGFGDHMEDTPFCFQFSSKESDNWSSCPISSDLGPDPNTAENIFREIKERALRQHKGR